MPAPALDRLRQTAGRFLKVTGPPARTVRDTVTREVGRRLGGRSTRQDRDTPVTRTSPDTPVTPTTASRAPAERRPTPASIARNVAHERPRATPATSRRDPEATPGGKLPPRRPRPA